MKRSEILGMIAIVLLLAASAFFVYRALSHRPLAEETFAKLSTPQSQPPRSTMLDPEFVYDSAARFSVYTSPTAYRNFAALPDAVLYAASIPGAEVYDLRTRYVVWDNTITPPSAAQIADVPFIRQLPELPRGCEVTSLAMLIQYMGVAADKMTLAEEVAKDPTPYSRENGVTTFGNPHRGFVGSMTDASQNGLGVYHEPIFELLKLYCPAAIDLSGCGFEVVEYYINKARPVWVVMTSTYNVLPNSAFETWETPDGPVTVTYSEHSVLVTGYDDTRVYFNDPLGALSSASKANFILAWEQMGRQAVSCAP